MVRTNSISQNGQLPGADSQRPVVLAQRFCRCAVQWESAVGSPLEVPMYRLFGALVLICLIPIGSNADMIALDQITQHLIGSLRQDQRRAVSAKLEAQVSLTKSASDFLKSNSQGSLVRLAARPPTPIGVPTPVAGAQQGLATATAALNALNGPPYAV